MSPFLRWDDVLLMDSLFFDRFVLKFFEEFLNWEPFDVVIDHQKVGPISLKKEFESSTHTVEKFTLKSHSLEVLRRCYLQSHFYHLKGILSFECFSFLLLFHDIGKNLAVIWSGSKKNQHRYTVPILHFILKRKGCLSWFPLLSAIIAMDPLGQFLKGIRSLSETQKQIEEGVEKSKKSANHFFKILEFYYFCDASAYPSLKKKVFKHTFGGQMILSPSHSRYSEFFELRKHFIGRKYLTVQ